MTNKASWLVRKARAGDRERLQQFRCASDGEEWETEVERIINDSLLKWAQSERALQVDGRLLLLIDRESGDIVGVVAHELCDLTNGKEHFEATFLKVIAIASKWQGKTFSTGERVSDVLGSMAMEDIARRRPRRDSWVWAKVDERNEKALRLCRRFGLTHEMSQRDPPYRRLITANR